MLHVKVSPPRSPMRPGFGKKPGPEDEVQTTVSQEHTARLLGAQFAKRLMLLPSDGPSRQAACLLPACLLPAAQIGLAHRVAGAPAPTLVAECHSRQARGSRGVQR